MPRRFAGGMGRGAALLEGCQGCHHSPCRLAVAVPSPEIPTVNGKAQRDFNCCKGVRTSPAAKYMPRSSAIPKHERGGVQGGGERGQ